MHFTTIAAAVLPALALAAPAGTAPPANVVNNCAFPIYVKDQPQSGGPAGAVQTIAPKATFSITQAGAQFLYVGTSPALAKPLTFGYSYTSPNTYYDLSDQFGNPFAKYKQTLTAGQAGCAAVSCAAGDEACYSNGNHLHINACGGNFALTMTTCAS